MGERQLSKLVTTVGEAENEKHIDALADRLRGEVRISITKATRDKAEDALRWAVILKLSNGGDFNLQGLASVLKRAWNYSKGVTFVSTSSNIALVKFDSEEQLVKVMDGGPWTFNGATVMIRRWFLDSCLELIEFDTVRIWVQLHNIPMDMLMDEITEEIAVVAGRVRKKASHDLEVMKRRFVRFQVEINVHEALTPGCYVDGWDGRPKWVAFKYERLPNFCKRCGTLDHLEALCKIESPSKRFGVWLRAESDVEWEPVSEEETAGVGMGVVQANTSATLSQRTREGDKVTALTEALVHERLDICEIDRPDVSAEKSGVEPDDRRTMLKGKRTVLQSSTSEQRMANSTNHTAISVTAEQMEIIHVTSDETLQKGKVNKGKEKERLVVTVQEGNWTDMDGLVMGQDKTTGLLISNSTNTDRTHGPRTDDKNCEGSKAQRKRKTRKRNTIGVRHQPLKPQQRRQDGRGCDDKIREDLGKEEATELTIGQLLSAEIARRSRRTK